MNHAQLRAFHAVASAGSYTRASEMLHVTQPTLSGQVKALEEAYGVRLFQRRGRGVELTDLGRRLLNVTRRLNSVEAEAEQLLAASRGLTGGQLRVGADAPAHVVPLLAAFSRRHPGVELSISFGNSEKVLQDLLARRSEIAVLADVAPDDRIYALPLRRDCLVAFVNRGHRWARRRSIRLAELSEERVILREPGSTTRAIFEGALAEHAIRPGGVLEIGSREAVREAVVAGLGVGLVFESEFGRDGRLHALALADAPLEAVESAACLEDRRAVRVVRAFFDLLRETAPLAIAAER
ncbi:MAG: LysR substrate-binding domain-containing protein [Kiloniellales bacterium]